jgi:hypothetical protein
LRYFLLLLFIINLTPPATVFGSELKLGWYPSPEDNVAGYKIYYGTRSRNYSTTIDIGNPSLVNGLVTTVIPDLRPLTTYYFSVVSYTTDRITSTFSQELSWSGKFNFNQDVFVDPTYDGQPENCLPTISQGCQIAKDGDTIYISAGNYHENILYQNPGHITFSPGWQAEFHKYTAETTTINGRLTITNGTIIITDRLEIASP